MLKSRNRFKLALLFLSLAMLYPLSAAKYAGEIFHYGMGVRNLALGGTGLTNINSASIAWWNPALLGNISENKVEFMHAEEYSGLLKYDNLSAIWGTNQKFALSLSRIAINDIPLTTLEDEGMPVSNDNRPYAYDNVTNSDIVAFFGFSHKIKNYTIGFTPKIAYRKLAKESGFGFGADISYFTQINPELMLALQIRDFFTTSLFWSNGTSESVYPSSNIEISYGKDLPWLNLPYRAYLRSEIFFEGREEAAMISISPVSIDLHSGLEISIIPQLELLTGYDIDHLTLGFAGHYKQFQLIYSFAQQPELDNSHRFAINWSF